MTLRPLLLGAVFLGIASPSALAEHTLSYLYIEANTGTSSGGHVGAKLDDTVYHFQNKDGLILLERDPWDRFQHLYSDLDNRDIHLAYLAVPESDIQSIHDHLDTLFLEQTARLSWIASSEQDLELLKALHQRIPFEIPGAGFFVDQPSSTVRKSEWSHSPMNREDAEKRLREIVIQRERLRYQPATAVDLGQKSLSSPQGFASQWTELSQHQIAFEWILGLRHLEASTLLDGGPLTGKSTEASCSDREWLMRYRKRLEGDALKILGNPYPGSGLALLRMLARAETIRLSLEKKRLFLLRSSTEADPHRQERDDYFTIGQSKLEADLNQRLEALKSDLFCDQDTDDFRYHRLELVALDLSQTRDATAARRAVIFGDDPGLPKGMGWIPTDPHQYDGMPSESEIEELKRESERRKSSLMESMRYHLITRNCVTQLIQSVNSSFPDQQEPPSFGGHIKPLESQAYIPFRFFELVRHRYPVSALEDILSFRHRALTEKRADQDNLWTALQEGNTLTGTRYQPREQDGLFLFFTDGDPWIRPLLGTVNLTLGLSGTTLGLLTAPWDQGRLLEAGAKGSLFSLPELVFWNIRKGSYTEATLRH
jgi:hypothetical protein